MKKIERLSRCRLSRFVFIGDCRRPQAPRQRHGLWTHHPLALAGSPLAPVMS